MNTVIIKMLPYAESGIISLQNDETLVIRGFRSDIDLEALQTELEAEWLDLAKQEATNRVKAALNTATERLRPAGFTDLMAKLQLRRINPAGRQTLNEYYDKLDALEQEAAALQIAIAQADSVGALNSIPWPEWVEWEALPLRFKLEVEPDPVKLEPAEPRPVKSDPVESEASNK